MMLPLTQLLPQVLQPRQSQPDISRLWSDEERQQTPPLKSNDRRVRSLGLWLIWGGFSAMLLWAALAPLDKGVSANGQLAVSGNRKMVQHLSGGLVDQILVKNGDQVAAGQLLLELNPVQAKARFVSLRTQYLNLKVQVARLQAETAGEAMIHLAADPLLEPAALAEVLPLQQQLLNNRQSALQTELSAMDESMVGLKASLTGLIKSRQSKESQRDKLNEQLQGLRQLAADGNVARYQLLESERFYAQIDGAISEDIGKTGRLQSQILELQLRRAQRQQEYQREVSAELAQQKLTLDDVSSRLQAAQFELENTRVLAPVAGTVVEMQVFTEGGVVHAGSELMQIVPSNSELIVEAQLRPDWVDKVRPGLEVELMFSAFDQNSTPRLFGEVQLVAADSIIDQRSGVSFYPLTIAIHHSSLEKVEHLEFRPGMPVHVMIKTGERSLLNYLFKPLLDRTQTALTEE